MSEAASLRRVRVELDDELERLRQSGRVPAQRVQELELRFATHIPPAGTGGSPLRQALAMADAASTLDEAVPVGSRIAGGGLVKRAVHRLVGWYVRFFVTQLHRGLWGVVRSLHVLVDAVEQMQQDLSGSLGDEDAGSDSPQADDEDARWWAPLLDAVMPAGTDGVVRESAGRSSAADEIRRYPPGALRGVLLQGSSQAGSAKGRARLVEAVGSQLGKHGVLAVVSLTPQAWARSASPVADDLGDRRPLHAATWVRLLERSGFVEITVHRGGQDLSVAQPGAVSDAGPALASLLSTVNTLVGGPDEYLVVGRRP